jgi:hypothetical protein
MAAVVRQVSKTRRFIGVLRECADVLMRKYANDELLMMNYLNYAKALVDKRKMI